MLKRPSRGLSQPHGLAPQEIFLPPEEEARAAFLSKSPGEAEQEDSLGLRLTWTGSIAFPNYLHHTLPKMRPPVQ